jgi:hypothetical protein
MALMTVAEVITAAYTRNVDTNQLKTSDIEMAQFEYIRPVLTENLYDLVVAAPTTTYSTLVTTYIKPCLAYFVKYLTFESFYTEVSDRGINHLTGDNIQTVSSQARSDAKAEVLHKAQILEEKLLDYVQAQYFDGDSDYTTFGQETDVYLEKQFVGGFLVDDEIINPDYKDDFRRLR